MIKIWVDDERPMPEGYGHWAKTVWDALFFYAAQCGYNADFPDNIEVMLDLDHDAGAYIAEGGDYINILKALARLTDYGWTWCEADGKIKVHFHSANPVGVKNMRAIVKNCPWMEEV